MRRCGDLHVERSHDHLLLHNVSDMYAVCCALNFWCVQVAAYIILILRSSRESYFRPLASTPLSM